MSFPLYIRCPSPANLTDSPQTAGQTERIYISDVYSSNDDNSDRQALLIHLRGGRVPEGIGRRLVSPRLPGRVAPRGRGRGASGFSSVSK